MPAKPSSARKPSSEPRLSRSRKPEHLSAADWQLGLRRQFGSEQAFSAEALDEPMSYLVANPKSKGRYRVALRGLKPGDNFCTCPDFATNDLGSCKHIEFMLARLPARGKVRKLLAQGYAPPYSEVFLSHQGPRRLRFRAGTACPANLAAQGAALFDDAGDKSADGLEGFLRAAAKAGHELRCHDDASAFAAEHRDARRRLELLAQALPRGAKDRALRKLLKVPLYPYQAEGALFAARAGRALIGDEMGLGKTIQAIAAAELLTRHCGAERVLIVCPTSLKHQWQREIERFSTRTAGVVQGPRAERHRQWRDAGAATEPPWALITNYETLERDLEAIQSWAPDLVIVDEAQRVKNWNTVAARALRLIVSSYAIVLTGTPLQNRLEELIAIVQFVDQRRLGPTWRLLHEHQQFDESGRVVGYRDLDRIGATLAPIMLRRRKSEVLPQLPARVDKNFFVPMTPEQRLHHDENGDIVARIVSRWRRTGFLSDADQRRLTCALQNMRMSCNSTYLLDDTTDHGHKVDELMLLLEELFEQPGAKAVIFSQWLRTHELIARRLQARGWGHVLFHGGVPGDERAALVDRFHADGDCRLFLSTDAGGVGLNLQHAAATVINMDLPWNPAVLEQRIGRVYRLGQQQGVSVVNFVAQGGIEEGMLSVLAFKQSLFAGVLDGGESEVFMHGTRLSKFMETVDEVTQTMGSAEVAEPAEPAPPTAGAPAEPPQPASQDPWAPLVEAGLGLMQSLLAGDADGQGAGLQRFVERDPGTGQQVLKLPLPQPETLQRVAQGLGALLASLRGGGA